MDLDLSAARRVLDRQPFSATLGTRISAFGPDRAVLELAVRDDLRQQLGFVHGGVRAPTFLHATGHEQVRSLVAALAGDWEAARDVQLELPETGVSSSNLAFEEPEDEAAEDEAAAAAACCGPAPTETKRGLATGVSSGLLAQPLVQITPRGLQSDGCCG